MHVLGGSGHLSPLRKWSATGAYFAAFWTVGIVIASIGPSLVMLGRQVGKESTDVAFVLPVRSLGYLGGSVAGGLLFDRFAHRANPLLAASVLLAAAGTAAIPLCTTLAGLVFAVATQGACMGALDTGGNVLLIRLHGAGVAPYMQALHFFFALGALVSPLLIRALTGGDDETRLGAFFYITAVFFLLVAVWIGVTPTPPARAGETAGHDGSGGDAGGSRARRPALAMVIAAAVLLGAYVGAEVSYGAYIYLYAVEALHIAEAHGDVLVALFWGFLCLGRLLAVFHALLLDSEWMLFGNITGCLASSFVLLLASHASPATAAGSSLWGGTAVFGLMMGPIFPAVFNLVESYVDVTGKMASVLVIGASAGELALPAILAVVFHGGESTYRRLFDAMFGCCFIMVLLLAATVSAGRRAKDADGGKSASPLEFDTL